MTLAEFLLARIAEGEGRFTALGLPDDEFYVKGAFADTIRELALRLLAECEAKRRIVDLHKPQPPTNDVCSTCYADGGGWDDIVPMSLPCPTLRALALPYADHPDYRDEWRP